VHQRRRHRRSGWRLHRARSISSQCLTHTSIISERGNSLGSTWPGNE
jgi:hypothetical protein